MNTNEVDFIEKSNEKGCVIPLPFSAYTYFEAHKYSFKEHDTKMREWVDKSTSNYDIEKKIDYIKNAFLLIGKTDSTLERLLIANIDKVIILSDFSGVDLGVQVFENGEYISFWYKNEV